MSLALSRFLSKDLLKKFGNNKKICQHFAVEPACFTTLSKQSAEEYKKHNYYNRMKKTKRPISPHMMVFKFPFIALTSVTNRITGTALSVYAFGFGCAEMIGGSGTSLEMMQYLGSQGYGVSILAKGAFGFPVIYHYLGALRHTIWDHNPQLLTNKDGNRASLLLVGTSVAATAGVMFLV